MNLSSDTIIWENEENIEKVISYKKYQDLVVFCGSFQFLLCLMQSRRREWKVSHNI